MTGLIANMAGGVVYSDYNGPVFFRYIAMSGFARLTVICIVNSNIITPENNSSNRLITDNEIFPG